MRFGAVVLVLIYIGVLFVDADDGLTILVSHVELAVRTEPKRGAGHLHLGRRATVA